MQLILGVTNKRTYWDPWVQIKKDSKDQESSTTTVPGYQMGK